MAKITNPQTGEIIELPSDFDGLYKIERDIKAQIEALEEMKAKVREQMQIKLTREPGQKWQGNGYTAAIYENITKEFDVDRVKDLIGEKMGFTVTVKGKQSYVPFYKPVAANIQKYLAAKLEAGALSEQDAKKYQDSFIEKISKPYVKITEEK